MMDRKTVKSFHKNGTGTERNTNVILCMYMYMHSAHTTHLHLRTAGKDGVRPSCVEHYNVHTQLMCMPNGQVCQQHNIMCSTTSNNTNTSFYHQGSQIPFCTKLTFLIFSHCRIVQLNRGLAFPLPCVPLCVFPLAVGMKASHESVLERAVVVRMLELVLVVVPPHHVHICWEGTEDMNHLLASD